MNRFDIVRQYWPERSIFQGAATAYVRYSSQPRRPWVYLEEPLWRHVLSFFPNTTRLLDFGAGSGKLTWAAITSHISPFNITAFEPNSILQKAFKENLPYVTCVRRANKTLSHSGWAKNGFSLISANMVINHIDHHDFDDFVSQSNRMLGPKGTLVYTIPHPNHEAMELGIAPNIHEAKREGPAPWGGFTEYFHRSVERQVRTLRKQRFHIGLIEWGYEDALHGFQIEPHEEEAGHDLRGPRRLMVIARKGRSIPESMLIPPSIRPTSLPRYELQECFGETPGISERIQKANLQEATRRFHQTIS